MFLKKTEFKNIVAARAVLWCVVPEVGTMARTWTLNAAELLRVVWEGELDGVLKEVTQECASSEYFNDRADRFRCTRRYLCYTQRAQGPRTRRRESRGGIRFGIPQESESPKE